MAKRVATIKIFCNLLAAVTLSACSQLPGSGPKSQDITTGATASLKTDADKHNPSLDYALIDIDPSVLDSLKKTKPFSFYRTFRARNRPPSAVQIGPGDVLRVTIYESTVGGTILNQQPGAGSGNYASAAVGNTSVLPDQRVTVGGTIAVPYVGRIRVAGQSLHATERLIEKRLANRAVEPQAIVSLVEQNSASVALVGDALNSANVFQVRGSGERLLDMISKAGGLKFPAFEVFVTVQRYGQRATLHFPRIVNFPRENLFVLPGDTINVFRKQEQFTALGAMGSSAQTGGVITGQYTFGQERLSLNEAIAKAGWLQDNRADPAQVFLYRAEFRATLKRMGVDLRKFAPEQQWIPTVYRVNFRDPTAFFFAQEFPMRHKDLIYAANSDSTEVVKFLNYINAITSTASGTVGDAKSVRDDIVNWAVP